MVSSTQIAPQLQSTIVATKMVNGVGVVLCVCIATRCRILCHYDYTVFPFFRDTAVIGQRMVRQMRTHFFQRHTIHHSLQLGGPAIDGNWLWVRRQLSHSLREAHQTQKRSPLLNTPATTNSNAVDGPSSRHSQMPRLFIRLSSLGENKIVYRLGYITHASYIDICNIMYRPLLQYHYFLFASYIVLDPSGPVVPEPCAVALSSGPLRAAIWSNFLVLCLMLAAFNILVAFFLRWRAV